MDHSRETCQTFTSVLLVYDSCHYFPVSIPSNGSVLNITVQSYLDNLDFGLIACRAAVPDIEKLTEFLAEEFQRLKKAAGETPEKKVKKIEMKQVKAAQRSA